MRKAGYNESKQRERRRSRDRPLLLPSFPWAPLLTNPDSLLFRRHHHFPILKSSSSNTAVEMPETIAAQNEAEAHGKGVFVIHRSQYRV